MLAASLTNCSCDDVVVVQVSARIQLSTPEGDQVTPLCEGDNDNCRLSFGEVPLATWTERVVRIKNPVNLNLEVAEIRLSADSDPAFEVIADPVLVRGGMEIEFTARVRPNVEADARGTIEIISNASNSAAMENDCNYPDFGWQGDPDQVPMSAPQACSLTTIELVAAGVDLGVPQMVLIPMPGRQAADGSNAACEFGAVGQGDTAVCRIQIRNVGQRVLTLDDLLFDPANPSSRPDPESDPVPVFTFGGSVNTPIMIEAGAAANLVVSFAPPGLNSYEGQLSLQTNDPRFPQPVGVQVDLLGIGHQAPLARCGILSVDGETDFDPDESIEPLSDVRLTAEESLTEVEGASIESYEWTILSAPDGSTADIDDPGATIAGFQFENSGRMRAGLDLAGAYAVQLIVRDNFGVRSQPCVVEFEAIPQDAIAIQLIWDHPSSDADIHMLRGGDSRVYRDNNLDCFYRNCRESLDWGATLDIDDVNGYGPENITVDDPGRFDYLMAAHYFTARPTNGGVRETIATMRVYLYGLLSCEVDALLQDTGSWWEAVVITTEKGGLCNDDSDCRNGQTCSVDTTALSCSDDQDCPSDYGCSVDEVCEQRLCRGSRFVCHPTHRPVDPIPPQN
jgi:hypothetical protein